MWGAGRVGARVALAGGGGRPTRRPAQHLWLFCLSFPPSFPARLFIHSVTHSFIRWALSMSYGPGKGLGAGRRAGNQSSRKSCPQGAYGWEQGSGSDQILPLLLQGLGSEGEGSPVRLGDRGACRVLGSRKGVLEQGQESARRRDRNEGLRADTRQV